MKKPISVHHTLFPFSLAIILYISFSCSPPSPTPPHSEDPSGLHPVSLPFGSPEHFAQKKPGLAFIENKGQLTSPNQALYYIEEAGMHCLLKADGMSYVWNRKVAEETEGSFSYSVEHIDIQWSGANPNCTIIPSIPNPDKRHYYTADFPEGLLGIQSYRELLYQDLYDHIDLKLYIHDEHIKYDFIVKPGGNVSDIALSYQGQDSIFLNPNGDLVLRNSLGSLKDEKPYTYQLREGQAQEITSAYHLEETLIRFQVDTYDSTENLVIDPSVLWSTFYGTEESEIGRAVCVDQEGNVYLAGQVSGYSPDFAIDIYQEGQDFQPSIYKGDTDAFLAKFAPNGDRIWAMYYGGPEEDVAQSVCTDDNLNVIISGYTQSNAGIAYNGHDETYNENHNDGNRFDRDAFLVKFNSEGIRSWGTYYGGEDVESTTDSKVEEGWAVGTDPDGRIYLTGFTTSETHIASSDGYDDTANGNFDAFLAKFTSGGSRIWATYFGGSEDDRAYSLCVNSTGEVYIAGITESNGLGIGGHDNSYSEDIDAFMAKFDAQGNLYWSTYYGDQGVDKAHSIITDGSYVYLAGMTTSSNFIAHNGHDNSYNGGTDNFLVKFNFFGTRIWGTYFGGEGNEGYNSNNGFSVGRSASICLSPNGEIYLAGKTESKTKIATDYALQSDLNDNQSDIYSDGFIARYFPDGSLKWASYLGGIYDDEVWGISTSVTGEVYLAGMTRSPDYITQNGFQEVYEGGTDAFLTKIDIYGEGGPGGPDDVDGGGRQDEPYGQKDPRFTLAPNPSYGKTTARYEGASKGPFQIEVLNKQGKTVYRSKELKGLSKETLDLTHLRKGLYFVTLQSASEKYSEELLIK